MSTGNDDLIARGNALSKRLDDLAWAHLPASVGDLLADVAHFHRDYLAAEKDSSS